MSDTYADPPRDTEALEVSGWPQSPERTVKVGHLVTGLVFLGLAGAWALRADGTLGDLEIAVVVPVVLVVAGAIGLLALLVGNRRTASRRRRRQAGTRGLVTGPPPSPAGQDIHEDIHEDIDETQPINKEQ